MILAIVQARMGSSRLPGKVLKEIKGKPLIELLFQRLSRSEKINKIILAAPDTSENNLLVETIEGLGFDVFRGSEDDVLDRYYQAARKFQASTVVRVTGDCPLIDPLIIDAAIVKFEQEQVDYLNNVTPPSYPDGMDVEVFTYQTLANTWKEAASAHDREHMSLFIRRNDCFSKAYLTNDEDYSSERLTVDEPEDFQVIDGIIDHFWPDLEFGMDDIIQLKRSNPSLFIHNKTIGRDEGSAMGTGQKLWKRAKKVIPGGNMLLSKRAEMFLPERWPAYFSKAQGCKVWDLDGVEYTDMSIMGIGTNTLGYGHPEVDAAVRNVVDQGNMSTFNCPEEVYLAERLVELHPWADMVRYARSGGEANAIAVRIARAAAGRDKVAVCGYHGWHDWYLAANLGNDKSLDGHLLPGLEPRGVPRTLKDTVLPFRYNHIEEVEALIREHPDIGVIKTEVQRSEAPKDGFLEKLRTLATENNMVLIFDECTSGFRETLGGLHKKYGVEPDMAVFGKALGNGYAITAVIGKRDVMEAAQSSFISSTFWTERIGPTAALKTLEVMERDRSWEQITETGKFIQGKWRELAKRHSLDIEIGGIPAISSFSFNSENNLEYKTLITQELLEAGILSSNLVFACIAHTTELMEPYFSELDRVFGRIKACEDGALIREMLKGPVCHGGFRRLA